MDAPVLLPAGAGPVDLGKIDTGRALSAGKWVVRVAGKGVDVEGNTVRGTTQLPVRIRAK